MNIFNKQKNTNGGFTIIEALVAIFILSISVASMLGVTATSASFARYANNEITANYLAQEAIDSIRNSRDTIAFQQKGDYADGLAWRAFLNRYGYRDGANSDRCFDATKGCYLKMESYDPTNIDYAGGSDVIGCLAEGCPILKFDSVLTGSSLFYNYSSGTDSIFSRKVYMTIDPAKEYEVKVRVVVEWNNGNGITNNSSRSLEVYLLNWAN